MALGTISLELAGGGRPGEPLFYDQIQFLGDTSYPDNGTPNFASLVAAALDKAGVEIVGILKAGACGGYEPIYDKANDKLMVYYGDYSNGSDGPAVQVPGTTALNGVTFDLIVVYR